MARRIKAKPKGYPWDQWTDGSRWELRAGKDFTCSISGFRATVYSRSKAIGRRVEVSERPNGILEVQFQGA